MRDLFEITTSDGSHPVRIADEGLAAIVGNLSPSVVIADEVFRDRLAGHDWPVVFVEAVEPSKEMTAIPTLIEACRNHGLARDGHLVAVGGGIIQDIAGFIATVYMRGVAWTYLPTTLLGMVDSCIGGKSSINVGAYKNLVGTFYPPEAVIVPPAVLATLAPEHVAAGRVEAAKICYARGRESFERFLARDDEGDFGGMIEASLGSKKWFVEIDEFDRSERLLLNFGHSFGHAIESCTSYAVPHGVAVGVGCLAAVSFSEAAGDGVGAQAVDSFVARMHAILGGVAGLAPALAAVDEAAFFRYFDSDKKHSKTAYRPILLDDDGALYRATLPREDPAKAGLWTAFTAARASLAG